VISCENKLFNETKIKEGKKNLIWKEINTELLKKLIFKDHIKYLN
jgi:hypothetical protein